MCYNDIVIIVVYDFSKIGEAVKNKMGYKYKLPKFTISFILCICIALTGIVPASAIFSVQTNALNETPVSEQILIGNGFSELDAVISDNLVPIHNDNVAKISRRKGNGVQRTIIRSIILGFIPAFLFSFVNLLFFCLYSVFGDIKQRMSIIIYIHNQDGQKRICLS